MISNIFVYVFVLAMMRKMKGFTMLLSKGETERINFSHPIVTLSSYIE